MHKTNLIQLLKVTNLEEIKGFLNHLKSNKSTANKPLIALLNYVKKYAPDYDSPKLAKAKVMVQLFKTEKGNNQKLNKLRYDLTIALQDFLIAYDIEQNEVLKQQLLLRALKKRNHPDYFKQSQKLIETTQCLWEKDLETKHFLTLFQLNYSVWSDVNTSKLTSVTQNLQKANDHLDVFYFLNKLKIIIEFNDAQSIIANTFKLTHETEILQLIKGHPTLKTHPTVHLLLLVLQLIKEETDANYLKLKTLFFNTVTKISKKDARDILVFLNNYLGRKIKNNTSFYAKEGLSLFQFADKHQLLLENNRIRAIEYSNAATYGFHTKNIDWTFRFIDKYKPFLASELQDATYALVKAKFYFQQKDYHQVSKSLNMIPIKYTLTGGLAAKIKTLNIRAFFELWELDDYTLNDKQFLNGLNNSFERYIATHPHLANNKKQGYRSFAKYLRELINIKGKLMLQSKKLQQLQQQLANNDGIILKDWLLSKMEAKIKNLLLLNEK